MTTSSSYSTSISSNWRLTLSTTTSLLSTKLLDQIPSKVITIKPTSTSKEHSLQSLNQPTPQSHHKGPSSTQSSALSSIPPSENNNLFYPILISCLAAFVIITVIVVCCCKYRQKISDSVFGPSITRKRRRSIFYQSDIEYKRSTKDLGIK
ncbi:hypothetical protein TrispH2_010910 [Trichoplax sp. H2]|nr:hypothetical protein TrispH2_010910 [Trichoplax sp. H2]|eukprot:RDD36857.1 hypothetical protein TrispH2_010910 [Trichoplax sp. H2]